MCKGNCNACQACQTEKPYTVIHDQYGVMYVEANDAIRPELTVSMGNSKTGDNVYCLNYPIYYTCDHRCECYRLKKCYAQGGCYNFPDNQRKYTANYIWTRQHTAAELAEKIVSLMTDPRVKKFRYFTCGDFTQKVLAAAVMVAKARPDVEFWAYTKKYSIVNAYIRAHGGSIEEAIPSNLVIIFSHWLNEDGTYFPMNNPYNFPTSEFIPCGQEQLAETVTHICRCSDPAVVANCENCDNPCYRLKPGQSMALLEHSTAATKARDKDLRLAHDAIKAAEKAAKKAARQAAKKAG